MSTGSGAIGRAAVALGAYATVDLARHVLMIPLGSTEQHGPHLPLRTDTQIARALAMEAATRLAASSSADGSEDSTPRVLVSDALPFGASGEHAGFAGTLSMGTEVLAATLVELVRSAGDEFDLVVFVNGHGGNADALRSAVNTLRNEQRRAAAWAPTFGGDAHAGRTETSLMLALAPELVRRERAAPGIREPIADLLPTLRERGLGAVSANGVLGDPTHASAREGSAMFDRAVHDLVDFIGLLAPVDRQVDR